MHAREADASRATAHAYRRLFEIGRGGMARVYLAESLASGLRKLVCLKVLNPEYCADPEVRRSFRREAELSARMNHPNIVQVMAVIDDTDAPLIVMEYLDGAPFSSLLRKEGEPLPLPMRLHILAQVLAGLHHFHELRDFDGTCLNAVHRDMSPQNVMVLHEGPVKVLDFGIAKINALDNQVTRTGIVKGKLQYMPPEQLLGGACIDRRADIFAVGVMLWEAVANRRMWEGKSEVELLRSLAHGTSPDLREFAPQVPQSVLEIVRRATDLDREQRYSNAREMQLAIERALASEGWLVQPSELVEFMARNFGEQRRAQELEIRDALREYETNPDETAARNQLVTPRDSGTPTVQSSSGKSRTLAARGHRWSWLFVALCVLTLIGTLRPGRSTPPATRTQAPQTVSSVTVEVQALPPGAEVLLDGRLVGHGAYSGQHQFTDAKSIIEVRAAGYLSDLKEVTFLKDMSLQVVLQPVASTAASAESTNVSLRGTPTRYAAERHPSARKAPQAAGRSSRYCSPPYTFDADGVKTYKPECF